MSSLESAADVGGDILGAMERAATRERRWRAAFSAAVASGGVALVAVIAVLSTQRTPLQWWVMPLWSLIPLSIAAMMVTQIGWRRAQADAAAAALEGAAASLRALADEIEVAQREFRDER